MKKSETNTCLIAGVLATSILLTGCGGGSGGGMSGLGAGGATGTAGATGGVTGTLGSLTDLLGNGGILLDANVLQDEGIQARALGQQDIADLAAAGILGTEGVQVLERNGQIIGLESPTGNVFGVPVNGVLPTVGGVTLPALPAGIPSVGILGL